MSVILYRRQLSKPSPRKRNAKWLSAEALQIAEKRKDAKGKREKEDILEFRIPKNSKER